MEQGFGFAHFILQCDAMGKGVLFCCWRCRSRAGI